MKTDDIKIKDERTEITYEDYDGDDEDNPGFRLGRLTLDTKYHDGRPGILRGTSDEYQTDLIEYMLEMNDGEYRERMLDVVIGKFGFKRVHDSLVNGMYCMERTNMCGYMKTIVLHAIDSGGFSDRYIDANISSGLAREFVLKVEAEVMSNEIQYWLKNESMSYWKDMLAGPLVKSKTRRDLAKAFKDGRFLEKVIAGFVRSRLDEFMNEKVRNELKRIRDV